MGRYAIGIANRVDMRKPENREKFKVAIEAMITFYGKRDAQMVAEVLIQEAEKAKKHVERGATGDEHQATDPPTP